MPSLQKIGLGLRAFGAGVAGTGQAFQETLDANRKQALLEDAFTVQQQLQSGDTQGARGVLLNRLQAIEQLGGNPKDTDALLLKLERGDIQGAFNDVSTVVDFGLASGDLKASTAPAADSLQVVDGQLVNLSKGTASPIAGFNPDNAAAQSRQANTQLRRREVRTKEEALAFQKQKLSSGLEKVLLTSQDSMIDRQGDARNFASLANEYETRANEIGSGFGQTLREGLKTIIGSQDDVTDTIRRLNAIRVKEGISNLPPGVASDKDIELVMSAQIRENANPEQVVIYLRGATKLAQYAAAYNELKANFISKKRTGSGLIKAWRKSFNSPALGRKVSVAEIYRTAQLQGLSPEETAQRLGIEEDLF